MIVNLFGRKWMLTPKAMRFIENFKAGFEYGFGFMFAVILMMFIGFLLFLAAWNYGAR